MKKPMTSNDKNHLIGRICLAIAILMILLVPFTIAFVLKTQPDYLAMLKSAVPLLVFIAGGFVEVMTYSPMLGTNGTYLAFITGNLVNLKVPCVVNSRKQANAKHGSKEGEIISTVSFATSTIVTTVIIALGIVLLFFLQPIFENEALKPAFSSAFTALFGALAYKYFTADIKLVPVPIVVAIIFALAFKLDSSVLIPICSVVSILYAYWLFKNGGKILPAKKESKK